MDWFVICGWAFFALRCLNVLVSLRFVSSPPEVKPDHWAYSAVTNGLLAVWIIMALGRIG